MSLFVVNGFVSIVDDVGLPAIMAIHIIYRGNNGRPGPNASVHDQNRQMLQTSLPISPSFRGLFSKILKSPQFPLGLFLRHQISPILGRRHAVLVTHFLNFLRKQKVVKKCVNLFSKCFKCGECSKKRAC